MKPRVLIVDDEPSIRKGLREILEFDDFEIEEAGDGLECLVKIKKSDKNFDVIVLDIKMPKMDGMEVLEKLKVLNPDIPIIMISGHANINTAVDSIKKGAYDFFSKPPDVERLLTSIKNASELSWENTKRTTIVKDEEGKYTSINIESPIEFRVIYHQYIIYFKEYLIQGKGIEIPFLTEETENGINIKVKQNKVVKRFRSWLQEYIDFTKVPEFEKCIEVEMEEYDLNMFRYEMEKQVRYFNEGLNWVKARNSIINKKTDQKGVNNYTLKFYNEEDKKKSVVKKSDKLRYKKLIGAGKSLEVLNEMIGLTIENDKELVNQLLVLQAQLTNLIIESGAGKINYEESNLQKNKIQSHLLILIDDFFKGN